MTAADVVMYAAWALWLSSVAASWRFRYRANRAPDIVRRLHLGQRAVNAAWAAVAFSAMGLGAAIIRCFQ